MNKSKWILAGILLFLIILIRLLISNFGWKISYGVSFWLLLVGIVFIAMIVIPKQYKRYAFLFAFIFLLLAISTIRKEARKDDKIPENQGQTVMIQNVPPSQMIWQEDVEVTGKEFEGKIVLVEEPGWYEIRYLGGGIYDTPEDKIRNTVYKIWGAGYDREWKPYFIYSNIPGVMGLEALLIVDGEVGSESGKVCQFPDGKTSFKIWVEKYVRFFRHEAFRPDINGNAYWCFQNNYGSWMFKILKVD